MKYMLKNNKISWNMKFSLLLALPPPSYILKYAGSLEIGCVLVSYLSSRSDDGAMQKLLAYVEVTE
jgi:hypothetical protein